MRFTDLPAPDCDDGGAHGESNDRPCCRPDLRHGKAAGTLRARDPSRKDRVGCRERHALAGAHQHAAGHEGRDGVIGCEGRHGREEAPYRHGCVQDDPASVPEATEPSHRLPSVRKRTDARVIAAC